MPTPPRQIDDRPIPARTSEIRLFAMIRNERDKLPYFLDYYRGQGINRFFMIDNQSTDGSTEYLLAQNDCHVFLAEGSFAEARSGIDWRAPLLEKYGSDHWTLCVDADELFVYPHCEKINLTQLCQFLDHEGSKTIFTFLVDMYPEGELAEAVYHPPSNFLEATPFFDKDYTFADRIHLKGDKPFPRQEVIGGPRTRCFYRYQGHNCLLWRLGMHLIERSIEILRSKGINIPRIRLKATPLFKVPLVKWKKGYAYTASTHQMNAVPISNISGALLHFKFFSDFHERAVQAVAHGQYAQGSIEYKQYLKHIDKVEDLFYSGSTRYRTSDDLLTHKLIQTTPAYEAFAK